MGIGSPKSRPEQQQNQHGLWWATGSEQKVAGVSEFHPDNHVTLTLSDSLDVDDRRDRVLHGVLGTREVTLTQARRGWRAGRSWSNKRGWTTTTPEEWRASGYFLGVHYDTPSAELFTSLTFTTPQLIEWITPPEVQSRTQYSADDKPESVSITFDVPAETSVDIAGVGRVLVGLPPAFGASSGRGHFRMEITPSWHVTLDRPRTTSDIYTNVVLPLMLWTTFCVGAGDRLTSISLGQPSDEPDDDGWRSVTWFPYGWTQDVHEDQRKPLWGHHVPHRDVVNRLSGLLSAWFELYQDAAGPVIESLLPFLEERARLIGPDFLRDMRAAEGHHRLAYGGQRFPENEWADFAERLAGVAEGREQRSLVKSWVKHGNDPGLDGRLRKLARESSPEVRRIAIANGETLDACAGLRNDYAHGKEIWPDKAMTMGAGSTLVAFMLRSLFLQRIGIAPEHTDRLLMSTGEWQSMQHLDPERKPSWHGDPFA